MKEQQRCLSEAREGSSRTQEVPGFVASGTILPESGVVWTRIFSHYCVLSGLFSAAILISRPCISYVT